MHSPTFLSLSLWKSPLFLLQFAPKSKKITWNSGAQDRRFSFRRRHSEMMWGQASISIRIVQWTSANDALARHQWWWVISRPIVYPPLSILTCPISSRHSQSRPPCMLPLSYRLPHPKSPLLLFPKSKKITWISGARDPRFSFKF